MLVRSLNAIYNLSATYICIVHSGLLLRCIFGIYVIVIYSRILHVWDNFFDIYFYF